MPCILTDICWLHGFDGKMHPLFLTGMSGKHICQGFLIWKLCADRNRPHACDSFMDIQYHLKFSKWVSQGYYACMIHPKCEGCVSFEEFHGLFLCCGIMFSLTLELVCWYTYCVIYCLPYPMYNSRTSISLGLILWTNHILLRRCTVLC